MADEELGPLMEEHIGVRNTTLDFLRSFSVLSDDSDFDELDEPDTPGDFFDATDGDISSLVEHSTVRHTITSGICVESGKHPDHLEGKIIPFSSIHKPAKAFAHIRPDCWMKDIPINARISHVQREHHPHMTRKAFNPNLYTIEVTHGEYKWTVRRRYKHFDSLHKALRLFRARYTLPMPTRQHRERRQSIREERKERKMKKRQKKSISRFPKKPEIMVREESIEKRRQHLEQYLQSILESKWYRNHTEVLKFLDVSELSFVNRLGQKWKEGDVNKCSGGRRISIGCCGCLKKYHVAGRWSKRWLVVKDTFIAYLRPSDGVLCDVMLMDSDFRVESGMSATGAPHGLLVMNQSRHLLAKSWTSRKADEWEASIKEAAETTGKDFTQENRYDSYAPARENSYARWFVDGASYFEAVAEALEKAKEEIFITDWWLSPEIYLKRYVTDREKWRLDEILGRKANEGVKVFVILYKELEMALTINSHYSKHALMNKSPNIKVIRHPDHVAGSNRVLLWAHHEKVVCIDQKTAFLGGFDLCYGRWDDDLHRMTDLGSVVYDSDKSADNTLPFPTHNGSVQSNRPSNRRNKSRHRPPSPIMESPENNMADSGIDESASNHRLESNVAGSQPVDESAGDTHMKKSDKSVIDNENSRNSLTSEHDFGSNDVLADNDSLESDNKVGLTNVVADVTVHAGDQDTKSSDNEAAQKLRFSDLALQMYNKVHQQKVANANGDLKSADGTENTQTSESKNVETNKEGEEDSHPVDVENIDFIDSSVSRNLDSQNKPDYVVVDSSGSLAQASGDIADDSVCSNGKNVSEEHVHSSVLKVANNGAKQTDLNRNQTKGSVRFKDEGGGDIQEEMIVPVRTQPVEGSPPGKKDAAMKRETWASRKLKKTFRLKDKEKYEVEDHPDGKVDRSDSDEEGSSHGGKFRSRWKMVLNIKKLEHGGKTSEDEETVPPESPFSKNMTATPHQSLSNRLLNPFRNQRQDSDDDDNLYYSLYPWKRLFRRNDENSSVQVKSVMKTSVADDYEGLEGSSKLWIGKDYINFIHKDPVDVHNPFEDFIERDKTPRMPWHDIGAVVYGKAARDVSRHFIQRWNFCKTEKFKTKKEFPILMPKSYTKCEVSPAIKDITYGVTTQILRSICGWSGGIKKTEKSIHSAYIDCIKRSKHYIYIENQFFISQAGDHSYVRNEIADALVERIERAYKENEAFRVYVVLPLLPAFEGEIGANGGYAIQAVLHWNYKSISKGENSVWAQLLKKVDDPKKYILFCGLRSHCELKGKLVTELVYVHSKLMIVDDDTVIIGSANINDRSMNGTRDSEIAVMVEDSQKFPVLMSGKEHMAGRFASSLRRTLFREHLGIKEMDFKIDLSDPTCNEFYKNVWLHRASVNTTIYHKVFRCIPDDRIKTFQMVTEITQSQPLAETDPEAAQTELKKIQGRIVFMPLYFLEYEETIMAGGANKEAVMPMKLWL
ncbi:phospholipase D1-like [Mercenaria mercenaria]|uniref:phospholipase D1-like n=1 Tax=Mercenaria mercenaria TaxID=6596 RepID=UPI00234F8077|nr:phospholipase D1-like [Mercenaria mercenaria]